MQLYDEFKFYLNVITGLVAITPSNLLSQIKSDLIINLWVNLVHAMSTEKMFKYRNYLNESAIFNHCSKRFFIRLVCSRNS